MSTKHFREYERADHRIIAKTLSQSHKVKNPSEATLDGISRLYSKKGGSWVLFFEGNPKHVALLKNVIKAVVKRSKKK